MTFRSVTEARSVLSAVEASWSETESELLPLMQKNPALTSAKLRQIAGKLRTAAASRQTLQMGDDIFTGLARYALGASKGNLILAKGILAGPNADMNLETTTELIDAAKLTIRSLRAVLSDVRTLQDWIGASGRSSSSLVRLNGLGMEPITIASIALIASVVFLAIAAYFIWDMWVRSYNSERVSVLANEACDRQERTGHPCTPDDFLRLAQEAAEVQNTISPPAGAGPADSFSDLIFYGGLLAIVAGVGYAVWTTLPAAQAYRMRHSIGDLSTKQAAENLKRAFEQEDDDWLAGRPPRDPHAVSQAIDAALEAGLLWEEVETIKKKVLREAKSRSI